MEWKYVIDPFGSGITDGFFSDIEYEFQRGEDGEIWRARPQDFNPLTNMWGLRFRPLPQTP